MIGLYKQSITKVHYTNAVKCNYVIGHERYCNCAERRQAAEMGNKRRKKTLAVKKAHSASELNTKALTEANVKTTPRSTSSEQVKNCAYSTMVTSNGTTKTVPLPGEKTPLLGSKIESLVRLFSCTSVSERNEARDALRHNGTYSYTALESDTNIVHERLEFELKARERAQNICLQYLKSCPRYTLLHQLNDVGSRMDKHWFLVRDSSVKTERLLTLVPRGSNCPVQCNFSTRETILDLFVALQHPYIYPVLDLNFREFGNKSYVIVTLPFNERGSLKDFIYKTQWQEDWGQKYSQRSTGLPISQIQRLGRQILEALMFLRDRGFPPCSHMHSGNIILQNGVARLTGLENTLLGYTSRIHPIIWSRAQSEPSAVDTLCFGHVLFEMCAGYELDTPQPTPGHLLDLHHYPQVVEVLDFIFDNPETHLPSIEELLLCDLFRNIDLREMRNLAQSTQVFKTDLTPSAIELLQDIKKFQNGRRRKQRSQSVSSPDGESSNSSQRDQSPSSGGSDADLEDDCYGADINSEPEILLKKEHRKLKLHSNTANRIICSRSSDSR